LLTLAVNILNVQRNMRIPSLPLRALSSSAAVALCSLISAHAQWTGSSGGDYLNTGNWSGGVINDTFSVSVTSPYVVNLNGNRTTTGNLSITTANTSFQLLTPSSSLGSPTTITLNGNLTFNPGNNSQNIQLGSNSGNPLNFNFNGGTREFTIQPGFQDKKNTSQFNGSISNGNLIKLGEGALEWRTQAASVMSGNTLTVLQGSLTLFAQAGGASFAPSVLNLGYSGARNGDNATGGVLTIRSDVNSTPINNGTTVINMNGGTVQLANGTQSNALTAGALNLTGGRSAFIDRDNNNSKALHFTNFARSNYGTLLLGGGDSTPDTVGTSLKVLVTNDSNITSGLIGTSTTAGTTNLKILPWAAATSQRDVNYTPSVKNNPATGGFLTYDSTNGFRALNLSTEYKDVSTAASDDNAKYSGGSTYTLSGNQTVNSLTFYANSSNPTVALGSNTLTVSSGGILNLGNTDGSVPQASFTGSGGTIAFGSNPGYLWAGTNGDANIGIDTKISGSGGLVIASGYVKLTSNSSGAALSGPIVVQGGLRVESSNVLNANTNIVLAGGAGINFQANKDNNDWGVLKYTTNITASNLSGVGRLSDEGIKQVNLVGTGGTLANITGAANQQVTVGNTASVSPGDPTGGVQQAGQIILSNNIQGMRFNSGSTLDLDLASDTQFDQLSLWSSTGGLTGFTFDSGSTIQISLLNGYAPIVGSSWQVFSVINNSTSIFSAGATITGNTNPSFVGVGSASTYTFALSNDGILSVTNITTVPEPSSTAAAICLGLGVLAAARRRATARCRV
jgi:hypothetical protein